MLEVLIGTILVCAALTWYFWRLAHIRIEITPTEVVEIGVLHVRRRVARADILGVEVARVSDVPGLSGSNTDYITWIPVLRTSIAADLPVGSMVSPSPADAEMKADTLRRMLGMTPPRQLLGDVDGTALHWDE